MDEGYRLIHWMHYRIQALLVMGHAPGLRHDITEYQANDKEVLVAEICKIMSQEEWDASLAVGRIYVAVTEADLRDGFIHCSSSEQVPGTLDKWYKDYERVIVVTVDPAPLTSEVKWEPNAVGVLFPHIYGPIVPEAVAEAVALERDGSGRFQPTGEEI